MRSTSVALEPKDFAASTPSLSRSARSRPVRRGRRTSAALAVWDQPAQSETQDRTVHQETTDDQELQEPQDPTLPTITSFLKPKTSASSAHPVQLEPQDSPDPRDHPETQELLETRDQMDDQDHLEHPVLRDHPDQTATTVSQDSPAHPDRSAPSHRRPDLPDSPESPDHKDLPDPTDAQETRAPLAHPDLRETQDRTEPQETQEHPESQEHQEKTVSRSVRSLPTTSHRPWILSRTTTLCYESVPLTSFCLLIYFFVVFS